MAKLQIVYDVSDDIEEIIKILEEHINLNKDETITYNIIQSKFQMAFNQGRRFQKQLNTKSGVQDNILCMIDI